MTPATASMLAPLPSSRQMQAGQSPSLVASKHNSVCESYVEHESMFRPCHTVFLGKDTALHVPRFAVNHASRCHINA